MEDSKYVRAASCVAFQYPEVKVEDVTQIQSHSENAKVNDKRRCWVCSSPLMPVLEDDGVKVVNVFQDLCTALNFTCVTTPDINKEMKNTDFCEQCFHSVRSCRNILQHIQRLQRKLNGLQKQLKKYIVKSYRGVEEGGTYDRRDIKICIKKTMVQCWSDCRVDVAQLTRLVDKKVSHKGSNFGEKPKRRPGRPRKNRKADCETKLEPTLVTNELETKLIIGNAAENDKLYEPILELEEPNFFEESVELESLELGKATEEKIEAVSDKLSRKSRKLADDGKSLKKIFKCEKCGKEYRNQSFYDAHMENHPEELPFPCGLCNRRFRLKQRLTVHLRSTHGDTQTKSDKAKLKFIDKCPHCALQFMNPEDVSGGVLNDKNFPEMLKKTKPGGTIITYKTETQKRNHIRTCKESPKIKSKSPKEAKLPCDQCEKTFVTRAALRSHIASIHNKSFKFCCDICGMGFQVSSMLHRHVQFVHSSEKKFECDTCHLKFRRSHQLFYHQRRHTGELPYICEFCGKGFHVQEKLRLHIKIHSEKKTVPCPICGKLFLCKQYVTNHVSTFHNKSRKGRIYSKRQSKKVSGGASKVEAVNASNTRSEISTKVAKQVISSQELHLEKASEIDLLEAGEEDSSNLVVENLDTCPGGIVDTVVIQGTSIDIEEKGSIPELTVNNGLQEKPPEFIFDGNNYVLEYIV